jgi:hypothetical protein
MSFKEAQHPRNSKGEWIDIPGSPRLSVAQHRSRKPTKNLTRNPLAAKTSFSEMGINNLADAAQMLYGMSVSTPAPKKRAKPRTKTSLAKGASVKRKR